ncbi:MAG TPA: hypothetical protein VGC79_12220 [Polyangiaceae bacterium]
MSDQYRLVELGNSELLAGLSELVRQSNELTAQGLAHLVEIEQRLLHLEQGFSSLFSYCVEALGMSEGRAGRRVPATRLCRRFPQLFERVARGELHLCALCALAPHLTPENAADLLEACRGKTRRQVEELLAARFPRPDVREQIRRLPARARGLAGAVEQILPPCPTPVESVESVESVEVESVEPVASVETPRTPGIAPSSAPPLLLHPPPSQLPPPLPPPVTARAYDARRRAREVEPLSNDRFGVHFTADAELRNLIERALAHHRLPNGDLAGLMMLMAACFVRQEEKRRFGIGASPRRTKAEMQAEPTKAKPMQAEPMQAEPMQAEPTKAKPRRTQTTRTALRRTPPGGVSLVPGATDPSTVESVEGAEGKRGRYLAIAVRRETYGRDLGQCAFVAADGRRCDARAFLEFDHVRPFARFGAGDAENIRLLCRAHNLLHARNCFGAMHIAAKVAAAKVAAAKVAAAKVAAAKVAARLRLGLCQPGDVRPAARSFEQRLSQGDARRSFRRFLWRPALTPGDGDSNRAHGLLEESSCTAQMELTRRPR